MSMEEVAGFTKAEWIVAMSRVMPSDEARTQMDDFFEQIAKSGGSNGFALSEETMALLALTSKSADDRVAAIMRHYPSEYRERVEALKALHRSEDES